jgi:hypothetical protein
MDQKPEEEGAAQATENIIFHSCGHFQVNQ